MKVESTAAVPTGKGLRGFLQALEEILLKVPRIVRMTIEMDGQIKYEQDLPEGQGPMRVHVEDVQPMVVVRSSATSIRTVDHTGMVGLIEALRMGAAQRLPCVGIVVGSIHSLVRMVEDTSPSLGGGEPSGMHPTLFGHQLYEDSTLENDKAVVIFAPRHSRMEVQEALMAVIVHLEDM